MDMAEFLWPTIGAVGLLIALLVGLSVVRSRVRDDPIKTARNQAQMKDIETYIRKLKEKENEAWSEVMTVMRDEDRELQTVYMNNVAKYNGSVSAEEDTDDAPLTELQKAFFTFWKIPANKVPETREEANRFIKAYKARLKVDGYAHRVRRWERLEVMMGRFYSDYNVEQLNERCEQLGMNKKILELLLGQTMSMLSKNLLSWRVVAEESAYQLVLKNLDNYYPKIHLDECRRG